MTKPDPDMSPCAVAARLDQVRALYRLCIHLKRARPVTNDKQAISGDVGGAK